MKKAASIILATAMTASLASAGGGGEGGGGFTDQFNEQGWGTLSGQTRWLSMYRDYDNGDNNHSSTLAIQLDYLSPEKEGWTAGLSYIGAGVVDSMYDNEPYPGDRLLANGRVNVFNEAFLDYNMEAFNLTNTTLTIGRRINEAEVFRANPYRHKSRAITAIQMESRDVENFRIAGGHAFRMSNWLDAEDQWDFNDFGDVFDVGYDTDGITWGEATYTGIDNLELAVFDAIAWDVANLLGARARLALGENTALLGYLRNETDIGDAAGHDANVLGISLEQTTENWKFEGGYFGVYGDDLRFHETTTGINHTLGTAMMVFAQHFSGDSNSFYAKASTKLEKTNATIFGLFNITLHDQSQTGIRFGQELNAGITQPIPKFDNLTAALKFGFGYLDGVNGADNILGTDTRLYLTYTF